MAGRNRSRPGRHRPLRPTQLRRVAITGSRDWGPGKLEVVRNALLTIGKFSIVIIGDAPGVDTLAKEVLEEIGLDRYLAWVRIEAEWQRLGKGAGPHRNKRMLLWKPDEVWYFHHDLAASKGTKNCINQALDKGIPVFDGQEIALRAPAE